MLAEIVMTPLIQTARLDVFPCPPQVARAAYGGKRQMETLLGSQISADWLDGEARSLLTYYAQWLEHDPAMLGWGLWLLKHRSDQVIFGSAGFKGKPNLSGQVEIGYGIGASYRRRGYTYEAAQALVNWAFQQPDVKRIVAESLPENAGSIRILEKLGMQRTGIEGAYIKWKLDKP
jgi:ribosomal-protein-alanine N-acetyltransferase